MSAAIIPARGGSQRIPRKNVREFMGRPMLAWAIGAAQESGVFSRVYVSTEDAEIAEVAQRYGARVIARPKELAQAEVGTQEVMAHAVMAAGLNPLETVCCLYPCAPLLSSRDLIAAFNVFNDGEFNYTIAVNGAHGGDTGWFYIGRARWFAIDAPLWTERTRVFPIEADRAIDINTPEDWARAESVFVEHRVAALRRTA